MRWRRVLIPIALAGLTAGLVAPAATQALAATTSPSTSLAESTVQDTALGTARTLDVPGGGYAVVHAFGTVSMVGASGQTQWQLDTQQLYRDWAVTWQPAEAYTEYPQLAWGTDPVDPLEFVGEANGLVNDANPAATGVIDGRPVVAVAETVGVNTSPESYLTVCLHCAWPFTVPGSSLHLGTFVSVLDARTGRMLYHEVDPGYVTQLAIAGGQLIVGDETGDPQSPNGIGQWGSVSTVRALAISANGTARQAWRYSTGAPWGRFLDVVVTDAGAHPGVAIAWSDTPPGLGVPGPPDGHVLLLDAATGTTRWQVRTPGYPVLAAADDQRGELAVVQQTDPTQSVGYTLTGLSYASGRTVLSAPGGSALPLSLAVGSGTSEGGWAVGGMDATLSSDGNYYIPSGAQVTLTDPATGRQLWLDKLPEGQGGPPNPDGLVITKGTVVVGALLDTPNPTPASPAQVVDSVTALDYRTARTDWQYTGDFGDPLSLSAVTDGPGLVRAVTSHQDLETYAADGRVTESTAAGPGDFLSAATASISAPGRTDLVAGNENGDVDAFDGPALAAGTEQLLWRAHLPGPVQDIVTATVGGRQVLVAAATSAIGVLDAHTGRLLRLISTPGTFAYTATVISAAGIPAVVVPGSSLTAYSLTTGTRLWSHAAPSGAWFSDAAYADGVVAAEYSSAESGSTPAAQMAAVGVSAATGTLVWSHAADPSTVLRGQLWNGTFASPDIAGADGDGVAFAWTTADGGSQVDVRDIATGALLYGDTSDDISAITQFLASPSLGLIAVSQTGSALITPSGAEASIYPEGLSGALATTSSGQQGFLTADAGVSAWGTDIFTTSSLPSEDFVGTYQAGTLVSGDFAGNGTQQAVAMPANWLGYTIVNQETGYRIFSNLVTVQHGLAVLTLHDAGTSSAAKAQAAPPSGVTQAPAYPAPSDSQQSADPPSGSQPAGTRPVGEAGSTTPVTEPARTASITPEASPVTARHTITAHGADEAVTPPGYSPAQMTAYLGLTGDGRGQTIAIVDAYNDPDIASDAETFSQQYGLPGVCGSGGTPGDCFTLDVEQQSPSAGTNAGWALETSLDVEWAHAIAPDATIKLVEASESDFASLFGAVATAVATDPAAVSMSWGYGGGEFSDETYYDHFCAVSVTACVVSAGDNGHPGSYPAYNPAVIAVGGTTLNLTGSGAVTGEQAWNGSGGGQSWVEPEPAYQDQAQSSGMREMPDVAFEADPSTGVAVYDSVPNGGQSGWWQVGGTSVGAPSWSAILADADQLRAAKAEPPLTVAGYAAQRAVYSLPASVLAPVTTGPDNGFCPEGCAPGPGYDEITGLGSPRAGIDTALATATG
jgi:hypothetical protein